MSNTDTENVVKSTDVVTKVPTSFKDLSKEQLVAAAEYFGTEDKGTNKVLVADLAASGVTWDMYVKAFELEGHEDLPELADIWPQEADIEDVSEEADETEIVTAKEVPELAPADKYLIKMTRKNPYFEFGRYKFTQEKPYAIMTANDAQRILETEKGFRQAFPAELQEFYS